jgi:hypothetical protein
MDVVYTYRVGGGPKRNWSIVIALDALPAWTTLAQLHHLAAHSRPNSNHWVLRSGGKAAVCEDFERAFELQTQWTNGLQPNEKIGFGRLAPRELVMQILDGITW